MFQRKKIKSGRKTYVLIGRKLVMSVESRIVELLISLSLCIDYLLRVSMEDG